MFLSIVIPAYNEEASIATTVAQHVEVLSRYPELAGQWEIVCLDDASHDRTWDVLNQCASRYPQLRLLRHQLNQGITISFNDLFLAAKGEFIYLTAADGQWPASQLDVLYKAYQRSKADFIIGVRKSRFKVYGPWRSMVSYGFNLWAFVLTGYFCRDINGIKFVRREILIKEVMGSSFFVEIKRLKYAKEHRFKIIRVPVDFISRQYGIAAGAKWENIIQTLKEWTGIALPKKSND